VYLLAILMIPIQVGLVVRKVLGWLVILLSPIVVMYFRISCTTNCLKKLYIRGLVDVNC
jgi:hypothetical protein